MGFEYKEGPFQYFFHVQIFYLIRTIFDFIKTYLKNDFWNFQQKKKLKLFHCDVISGDLFKKKQWSNFFENHSADFDEILHSFWDTIYSCLNERLFSITTTLKKHKKSSDVDRNLHFFSKKYMPRFQFLVFFSFLRSNTIKFGTIWSNRASCRA